MFDPESVRQRKVLRKLPYDFHYRYESTGPNGIETLRHMVTDWEVGALYWNCYSKYGSNWEAKFREKLEIDMSTKDMIFLMGTVHRFPDRWLIVGLIYPPKRQRSAAEQLTLQL